MRASNCIPCIGSIDNKKLNFVNETMKEYFYKIIMKKKRRVVKRVTVKRKMRLINAAANAAGPEPVNSVAVLCDSDKIYASALLNRPDLKIYYSAEELAVVRALIAGEKRIVGVLFFTKEGERVSVHSKILKILRKLGGKTLEIFGAYRQENGRVVLHSLSGDF